METGCENLKSIKNIYFYEITDTKTVLCFDEEEYQIAKTGINPLNNSSLPKGKWIKINSRNQFRGVNPGILDPVLEKLKRDRTAPSDLNEVIQIIRDSDPTDNKKYVMWIVNSYRLDGIKLFEDIPSRVKPALEDFELLLNRNQLNDVEKKINNWCGLIGCQAKRFFKKGLEELIDDHQDYINKVREKQTLEIKGRSEGELIFEDDEIKVISPLTQDAACYYGRGTKWCTAATRGENMFDYYNKDGPLYIIIPKRPTYQGEKYQIHFETYSFMNELDEDVDFPNLLDNYPTIMDINDKNFSDGVKSTLVYNKLEDAVEKDNNNLAKKIIMKNKDIMNVPQEIIMSVIEKNNLEILELLSNNGTVIDNKYMNIDGCTHLSKAIEQSNIEIVKFLLENGATIDEITYAKIVDLGGIEGLKFLLHYTSNIAPNTLFLIIRNKPDEHEIIKLLLENGANPYDEILNFGFIGRMLAKEYINSFEMAQRKEDQDILDILSEYQ